MNYSSMEKMLTDANSYLSEPLPEPHYLGYCINCDEFLSTISFPSNGNSSSSLPDLTLCQVCTGPQVCSLLAEVGICQSVPQSEQMTDSSAMHLACLICPWPTLFTSSMDYLTHYIVEHEAQGASNADVFAMASSNEALPLAASDKILRIELAGQHDNTDCSYIESNTYPRIKNSSSISEIDTSCGVANLAASQTPIVAPHIGAREQRQLIDAEFRSRGGQQVCGICGRAFRLAWRYQLHLKAAACRPARASISRSGKHASKDDSTCLTCGKVFANAMNLHRHELIHAGIRPHKCHLCEKAFVQKTQLISHLNCHSGARPYKCRFCSKAFSDRSTYCKHIRRHK